MSIPLELNKAWESTCKVVLGGEVGELAGYTDYLKKYVDPPSEKISTLSGKKVSFASPYIAKGAKVMSYDEMGEYAKKTEKLKLEMDDLKDIDSVLGALEERVYYAGNTVLGKSMGVHESDKCSDSFFVCNSHHIYDSKYIYYVANLRYGDYIFGSYSVEELKFCIRGFEAYKDARCFEVLRTYVSSDCYYVSNLEGCKNCMFSFNQRNKNYLIGNVQLSEEEYAKLSSKLLEDIRETLRSKKSAPTIVEVMGGIKDG
ncbi:MAG: hypothetical protein ABIH99_00325 [Candidatus Micrarchaeota archaeon]